MEITSFILGVCAVIVVMMIVGTSVNYMAIKTIKQNFDEYTRSTEGILKDLYQANEGLEERLINYVDQLNNNAQDEMNTIYKTIDSRADKLDDKFTKDLNEFKIMAVRLQEEVNRVERGYKEKINY